MTRQPGPWLICFAVREEADPFRPRCPVGAEILVTGMGPSAATAAIDPVLDRLGPALVLTCGFAGGLNPALRRSTVLLDADPGFPLVTALTAAGAVPARLVCRDRVAVTAGEKQRLREETGADAVEMESGVIREFCRRRGITAATLRVISDEAGEDLPVDFNALMTPGGGLNFVGLAAELLRAPDKIRNLLRLRRHTLEAAVALARVLVRGLPSG